jgi:hypothetical protein
MFSSVSSQPEKLLNKNPLTSGQQPVQPDFESEAPAGFLPPEAIAQIPAAGEKPPEAVIQFLNNYKLSKFELGFFRALKSGQLFQIAEAILQETGYQIIQLQELPAFVRGRFGVLEYPSGASRKTSYFLMWRPPLAVNDFRYNQKGPEIYSLQQMLAKLDLYRADVDGVVDFNLMTALSQFQIQMGLPATGAPDKQTLFLLCQMSGVE